MGNACTRPSSAPLSIKWTDHAPVPVTLHVYDVGSSVRSRLVNQLLRPLGTGAFHCGVEVYGWEWSYSGFNDAPRVQDLKNSGVFCCRPRCCEGHQYVESVPMGKTGMSELEVVRLLQEMEVLWLAADYDLLKRNCCHFCDVCCSGLGVGPIPSRVSSLAGVGAALSSISEVADVTCCRSTGVRSSGFDVYCCHTKEQSFWEEAVLTRLCCRGTVPARSSAEEEVVDVLEEQRRGHETTEQFPATTSGLVYLVSSTQEADPWTRNYSNAMQDFPVQAYPLTSTRGLVRGEASSPKREK